MRPTLMVLCLVAASCHDLALERLRCSVNGRCPDGYTCHDDGFCRRDGAGPVQGAPGSKKQGEACARADECATGSCADGVCCNTDCGDACSACNLPDNVGTC